MVLFLRRVAVHFNTSYITLNHYMKSQAWQNTTMKIRTLRELRFGDDPVSSAKTGYVFVLVAAYCVIR